MPKGVYKRSPKALEHNRTINIGRTPWNKGTKGKQVAWNKGLDGYKSGEANNRWRDGLTLTQRRELIAGRPRSERCEVCYEPGKVVFDHCHSRGHFRGWICRKCNLVLGLVKDDQTLLRNLAVYLDNAYEESRPKEIINGLLTYNSDTKVK